MRHLVIIMVTQQALAALMEKKKKMAAAAASGISNPPSVAASMQNKNRGLSYGTQQSLPGRFQSFGSGKKYYGS